MKNKGTLGRRSFVKTTLTAGIGAPMIVPSRVFGANAPSGRLTMGCIGVGGMGTTNMQKFITREDVRIVAVCDVDRLHRLNAKEIVDTKYGETHTCGPFHGCSHYNDFREIIDRKDIDLVLIATPDHWHAIPAIMAADAGKDIYCEKPIALTVPEGRAMCEAVRRNGTIWQTGSWQRSVENFRFACELVRNGRIGRLETVIVSLPTGSEIGPQPEMPIPEGFDYDFWLGPAPWAPYTEKRCHWNFRWIMDYSGGQLTDWAGHHCDIAHWGMDTELTGPVRIEGRGDFPSDGLWNTAKSYRFECLYENGLKMTVVNDAQEKRGIRFNGSEGWVHVDRESFDAHPKSLLTSIIAKNEIHLYKSTDHWGNFIDCVRSRAMTVAPIAILHRSVTIAHIGNIAMLLERPLQWDPGTERFINDPEANRMLSRAMRSPWGI